MLIETCRCIHAALPRQVQQRRADLQHWLKQCICRHCCCSMLLMLRGFYQLALQNLLHLLCASSNCSPSSAAA
jgi:hypothetical protein